MLSCQIIRINRILSIQGKGFDPKAVEIIMNRNYPDKSLEQAQIFEKYDGRISRKTLIENFADFVKNADEEMEQLKKEKEENVEAFGFEPTEDSGDSGPEDDEDSEGDSG